MTGPGSSQDRPVHPTRQECESVLERVYEFLDNECDEASGDAIRQHLVECEPCLDRFDVEQAVKALVNRCGGGDRAPEHLRAKVLTQISVARDDL